MILVDGFIAFHGTLRISPTAPHLKPFLISGDCLYKPDSDSWYVQPLHQLCRSFPADICEICCESPSGR